MRTATSLVGIVVTATTLTGCLVTDQEENCAMVFTYDGPVLTIDAATGPGGTSLATVRLSRIEIDGRPATRALRDEVRAYAPDGAVTDDETNRGLAIDEAGDLVCHLPCGFGTDAREIALTASTRDGLTVTRRVPVRYESSPDVCGGAAADGTHVELSGFE